ncbi:MAG: penicillin-binding protein 2, partial [Gammaproteobacteria bacterium]|nr:penicillin-binding protein 2 [Gammaproteobacteria bacterium]
MFHKKRRPVTPRDPHKIQYYNWRFRIVLALLALIFLGLLARMVDLMVIDRNFLQRQGDMRAMRTIEMQAYRGIISDRNGNPLAVSSPVFSVWVDPKSFKADNRQLKQLAALLQEPASQIQRDVQKNQNREFMYLKRQLPPSVGEKIDDLAIPGVFLKQEFRRFYPEGEVTAHVVGLTNVDDQGQEGLELAYNNWLGGVSGIRRVIQDRYGHIVSDVNLIREPAPGKDLTLSIDKRIQYIAYRELSAQIARVGASAGSVVVLDVHTGEVLAMANYPSYNPNDRPAKHDDRFRNRAVTDTFEPGSTIKTFSAVVGLTSGKYTPDSMFDTAPGWYIFAGHRIQDEHDQGTISLTDVLKYSSNVGISKVISSLPPYLLPQLLQRLKFGEKT